MRRDLIFAGALLLAGGIAVLVAAFIPALYPVWTARGINAIPLIAQHRGTWQLANWLFVAGAVLTLAGLGALAPLLNRPTHSALPSTALTLMTLASTLWIANLTFRLTITVRTADLTSAGSATPDWYEHRRTVVRRRPHRRPGDDRLRPRHDRRRSTAGLDRLDRHRTRRRHARPVPHHPRRTPIPALPGTNHIRRHRPHPGRLDQHNLRIARPSGWPRRTHVRRQERAIRSGHPATMLGYAHEGRDDLP